MHEKEPVILRKLLRSLEIGQLFHACTTTVLVLSLLGASTVTFAQGRGGPPGGGDRGGGGPPGGYSRGGPPSGGDNRSGTDRMIDMLRSTDTNRDGRIEISEVPEYRQGMVRGIFQRYGIDASRPVSFDQIRQRMSGGQPQPQPQPQPQGGRPPQGGAAQAQPAMDPLVPGFGVAQEAAAVHPFGARVEDASVSSFYGGGSGEEDDRTTRYAREAMQRYDRNRNGVIDRDEQGNMRSDPREIDRNHDGRITMDEMVHRVQQYQGGRGRGDDGDRGDSNDEEEERYTGVRYQPFRSIDAMIPEGTPEWFVRLDRNRDGNVSMIEYSTTWTTALALEFEWWDVNHDGLITPEECIEFSKKNAEDELGVEHPDPPPIEEQEEQREANEDSQGDEESSGEGDREREGGDAVPPQSEGGQPHVVVVQQGGEGGSMTITRQDGEESGAMTVQMHAVPSGGRPPESSRYEGSREGYSRGGGGDYGRGRGDGGGGGGGGYGRR